MKIRKATKADVSLLSRLNVEIQQMHAENVPEFFKVTESEDFAEEFHAMILDNENAHTFIAEVDGQAVGSMIVRIHSWRENCFNVHKDILYIDHISILAEHRGKGYGRALMERANQLAEEHKADYIALDTWAFNTGAQAFYRTLGYETAYLRMWRKMPGAE